MIFGHCLPYSFAARLARPFHLSRAAPYIGNNNRPDRFTGFLAATAPEFPFASSTITGKPLD